MHLMKNVVVFQNKLLTLLALLVCLHSQNASAKNDLYEYGNYDVGFKTIHTYDNTRNFRPATDFEGNNASGNITRPFTIYVWYPAKSGKVQQKMPFSKYVDLNLLSLNQEQLTVMEVKENRVAFQNELTRRLRGKKEITDANFHELLNEETNAYENAPEASGKFPLILNTSMRPTQQSVLGEYIASHGYVVAAIQKPGMMTKGYLEYTPNPYSIDTRVADIEFLYGHFRAVDNVDVNKMGLIAYSSASLANIIFQMRNMPSSVLMSFEGWEGFKKSEEVFEQSIYYDPVRIRVPYLRIGKKAEEKSPAYATTYDFFDAIKYANRYDVRFADAKHSSFLSMEMSTKTYTDFEREIFETALVQVKIFLDGYLKNDKSSIAQLQKSDGSIEGNIFDVNYKPALPAAPSEEEFYRILEQENGVNKAWKIYFSVKEREPSHKIFRENTLSRFDAKPEDQYKLLQIIADAYPNSFRALFNLGASQRENGNLVLAHVNIEKARLLLAKDLSISDGRRERIQNTIQVELDLLKSSLQPID